ncbi:MAG TPA: DUF1345 domain-containing protein [Acidimicrobiia bacterium]|nr:DUF1345 domain-containing protein [Acidimicrobiia bacterium]
MTTRYALQRLLVAAAAGVVVGAGTAFLVPWQTAILLGWDATAAIYLGRVWSSVGPMNSDETSAHATVEDSSRVAASVLLLSASVASLAGVGLDLVKADQAHTGGRVLLTVVGVVTVALSWAVVHTVFALRYAHEYYTAPVGGIDFKTTHERPNYQDFAYVAFTVGMTFQVSDTDIQARKVRRTVLRQALLSYLFGAVILAVVVNVIATLLNS